MMVARRYSVKQVLPPTRKQFESPPQVVRDLEEGHKPVSGREVKKSRATRDFFEMSCDFCNHVLKLVRIAT